MIRRKTIFTLVIGLYSVLVGFAQPDTTILSYQEYLENITRFHPLAKKANLQREIGAIKLLAAKGNLDPKISASWNEKNFDKKLYYEQYQAKFRIPTTTGIDVVGGYENTEGVFLNPENKTDAYGLWHVGLEVNLLQGLIVNERRTALEQAKILQNMTENEREIALNQLLYDASKTYLEWQKYHYFQEVLQENIAIANTYFENTKLSFQAGEKTAMDTLEAQIIFQDALYLAQQNETKLVKVRQNVENYLWYDEVPIELAPAAIPENYREDTFSVAINSEQTIAINNHPLILSYRNKQAYYEVEQRLKREKLKPKLKAKYNPLLATAEDNISPNFAISNYKWGFDFSMPLLFRKERAGVQEGAIKIQETVLELENKRNELKNKLEASIEQQRILQQQIILNQQNVEGYRVLLEGENEKFRYGESSVFLLNKRQEKYIDGQLKLIELYIKLEKEVLNYLYYSNDLL